MWKDDRKKTHPELQKWDTNDLTISSLAFGWFALPNFCVCNEDKRGGNDAVSCMQVFCAISQDAKCAFLRHMMFLIISVYVFIL